MKKLSYESVYGFIETIADYEFKNKKEATVKFEDIKREYGDIFPEDYNIADFIFDWSQAISERDCWHNTEEGWIDCRH